MATTYSPCPRCAALNRVDLERATSTPPRCARCKTLLELKGAVSPVDGAGLASLLRSSPLPVVVDFWAPWCGPCRAFAPVFSEAATRLAGQVVFAKLDTEASPEAAQRYRVQAIPTLIAFRGASEARRSAGAMPLGPFLEWLRPAAGAASSAAS